MDARDETIRYESLLKLSPPQVLAVDVLDAGGSQVEAAEKAGVSRVTVSRWLHHHPAFVAELNRRQVERASRVAARSDELTFKAMEVVAQAVEQGDTSAAIQWLRLLGPALHAGADRKRERPLSAEAIILHATETMAMSAPMQVISDPYRKSTLKGIISLTEQE